MRITALLTTMMATLLVTCPSLAQSPVTIESIIQNLGDSALSKEDMRKELEWFREKGKPFQNKTITVVSEDIPTHRWERDVLAKHFKNLTGINVKFDIIGEGAVVEAIFKQT